MTEMTQEEHAAIVPPPPGEEKAIESDDSNPDAEFWAELSNDEDEAPEEDVAPPPTAAAAEEPPPREPEPAPEAPVASQPIVEEPQAAPPAQAAAPEPAAPVPEAPAAAPQVDEEQVKAVAQKWQDDLADHYAGMMKDEEFATQLIAEPQKVLPRLMAQQTQVVMKNAYQMMRDEVPQMAQQMAQEVIAAELGKRAFFKKHPALRAHEKAFEPFLASYRQLPQNAQRSFEDVSGEAAVAFMVRNRIPQGTPQAPAGPSAPPPPPPVAQGAPAAAPQGNFWSSFADEIVEDDF